jgi:hypothetical protein
MLVLNTTSPVVSPAAPNARPVDTVPSSRASFACMVGLSGAGFVSGWQTRENQ